MVQGKKVSKPIVRISVISIALAMIVNLITLAVVTGFQQEVRQKVSGFGSHILIMNEGENSVYESAPIRKQQSFLTELAFNENIASIAPVAYKPVLLQSNKMEIKYQLANGKDTSETQYQVQGALVKGIDSTYDLSFFQQNLIRGEIPNFSEDSNQYKVVISESIAKDLNFNIGDKIGGLFVKNNPLKLNFDVVGIYNTGFEEMDKKIVLGSLKTTQELNDWGIKASFELQDTIIQGYLLFTAEAQGGNGNYRYDWGKGFTREYWQFLCPQKDTSFKVKITDFWSNVNEKTSESTMADSAEIFISIEKSTGKYCSFSLNQSQEIEREYLNEDGTKFRVNSPTKSLIFETKNGKGTANHYVGGFEIQVKDWEKLDETIDDVKLFTNNRLTEHGEVLRSSSIKENQPDIFVWLGFLDINVFIILLLMILIGIINMGSALLVLILIRSNFIGMMKAMGATNASIRKIFITQAGFLIGRGMIWGNIIGVGLCLLQQYTGIISLDPEVYYLSQAPIQLNFWHWLLLNLGTLVVCLSALIVPSMVVSRINPVKAIKFD